MVLIPLDPQGFDMGSPADEPERSPNENRHHVKLTKAYLMAAAWLHERSSALCPGDSSYVTEMEKHAKKAGDCLTNSWADRRGLATR